jgi:MFS family permease
MSGVFTLAASLIWAINTVFLITEAGMTLFQVMIINAIFTVGQMVFEIPTGVVADTIGRRAAILLSMATLVISTLLYVVAARLEWGFAGFAVASVILGLGYTFQTGSVDAWIVDALDAAGVGSPKERVFARGQVASSAGMLVGSLMGGLLGQIDLALPYLVRAGLLVGCFVLVAALVRDDGFVPRQLKTSTFVAEARSILDAGTRYGMRSPVVRPLLFISLFGGVFFMYGFYAWQPYVLDLLGNTNAVWLLGVAQAGFAAAGIAGNLLVGRVMGSDSQRRDPARVLFVTVVLVVAIVVGIALVGLAGIPTGVIAAAMAITLWIGFGFVFGLSGPIRMAYINEHIPSSQRATVLSLDAFFADAGGAVGQPGLGWLSDRVSIPVAWLVGAAFIAVGAPLYRISGKAAALLRGNGTTTKG